MIKTDANREIEAVRLELGKTQTAFGEAMAVTQATVSRWETGELQPNKRDLMAARALKTELSDQAA